MKTKLFIAAVILLIPSCNLTVSPDGTRHWSLNGEVTKAIIIKTTK